MATAIYAPDSLSSLRESLAIRLDAARGDLRVLGLTHRDGTAVRSRVGEALMRGPNPRPPRPQPSHWRDRPVPEGRPEGGSPVERLKNALIVVACLGLIAPSGVPWLATLGSA